jgi:hypothetical protein
MFRLLRLGIILMSILALTFVLACEGDQGPQGSQGDQGDPGDPGQDLAVQPPNDIYFSLAVFNQFDGSEIEYRSDDFIKISFDTTQTPDADLVVAPFLEQAPKIDGEDGDIDEWGVGEDLWESDILLEGVFGYDNEIDTVMIRCAYDATYIYFLLTWEETKIDSMEEDTLVMHIFEQAETRKLEEWVYSGFGDEARFIADGAEDRLWMMFLTDPDYVPVDGQDALLNGGLANASFGVSSMRVDVWDWRAALTDMAGFADDGYLVYEGGTAGDIMFDAGGAAFMKNINDTVPAWMYYTDPNADADYPFWFRYGVVFSPDNWIRNSTIPGYMAMIPYGDRGNVHAASFFQAPRWTVEFKRLRNTGSGNDIQF